MPRRGVQLHNPPTRLPFTTLPSGLIERVAGYIALAVIAAVLVASHGAHLF